MTNLNNQEKIKNIKALIKNPNKINKNTSVKQELIYNLLNYLNDNYQIYNSSTDKKNLKKCYSDHKILFQNLIKNSKNPKSCYFLIKKFPILYKYASLKSKALYLDNSLKHNNPDLFEKYLSKESLDLILEVLRLNSKNFFLLPKELQKNSYIKDFVFQYGYNRFMLIDKISVKQMSQFQSEGILYENPYKIHYFKQSKYKNKLYDFAFNLNPNIITSKFVPNKKLLLKSVFEFKKTDDMNLLKNPSVDLQKKFISLFPEDFGVLRKIDNTILKEIIDYSINNNKTFDHYDSKNFSNEQIEYVYFNHNILLNSLSSRQISKSFLLKIFNTQTFSKYSHINKNILQKYFESNFFELRKLPFNLLLSSFSISSGLIEQLLKQKNKKESLKLISDYISSVDLQSLTDDEQNYIKSNLYTFCCNYSYKIYQEKDPVCINNYISICSKLLSFYDNDSSRIIDDINDFIIDAKENKYYHKNDALLIMDLIS